MQELCKSFLRSLKKPILVFFFIILISFIVLADNLVENYNDPVTFSTGDSRWCKLNGVCTLNTLTVESIITGNLSVIGQVFNVTMNLVTWNITDNFNVGGNLVAKNITAIGEISGRNLDVDRDVDIGGELNLSGANATFEQDVTIKGTLHGGSPVKIEGINISNNLFMLEENRNSSSRFTLQNLNSGENATTALSAINDVGGTMSIGIGSSNFMIGSKNYQNITALFSKSRGDMAFANFFNKAFIWLTNPSDDNDPDNLVEVMRLDNNSLNLTVNSYFGDDLFMQGNKIEDVEDILVFDKYYISDLSHWLKRNASSIFYDTDHTIWFQHKPTHPAGAITYLFSYQNKTMLATQVGRNHSAGILGNSWMVIPNNLSTNLSVSSDCFQVANTLGKTLRVGCDTSDTGADLIVQDDIQAWGRLFVDEGIRSEGPADFILDDANFDIFGGELRISDDEFETVGFDEGDFARIFFEDFEAGLLSPFVLITNSGSPDEWEVDSHAICFDDECVRAGRVSAQGMDSIIEVNISTLNFDIINLTFRLNTTGLDSGDVFNATLLNSSGFGLELVTITDGTDINALIVNTSLGDAFNNKPLITLRFTCNVNKNDEECSVDDVTIWGNATTTTTANISIENAFIALGDETCSISLNGSSLGQTLTTSCPDMVNVGNLEIQSPSGHSGITMYDENNDARCMKCWSDSVCNSTVGKC